MRSVEAGRSDGDVRGGNNADEVRSVDEPGGSGVLDMKSGYSVDMRRNMVLAVVQAEYVGGFRILVSFNDGGEALVDLADFLDGEVFEPLKDVAFFKQFAIAGNTVEWPNGADFAPEFLREIGQGVRAVQRGDSKRTKARAPHAAVAEGKAK